MPQRLFSDRKRPVHLGPYALERLIRTDEAVRDVPAMTQLSFDRSETPQNIVNAMSPFMAMMDTIRDGLVAPVRSTIPCDLSERANHLKAFGYFQDASMMGVAQMPSKARLEKPMVNPGIPVLAEMLRTRQTKTLAAGIDLIMSDLRESLEATPRPIDTHTHVLVILHESPRAPRSDEPGFDWIDGAMAQRSALRAAETATVLANYIRVLGWEAKAHSATTSDLDLNYVAVAAGLTTVKDTQLAAPWIGEGFGLAAVSTTLELAKDRPLAPLDMQPRRELSGLSWRLGRHSAKSAYTQDPFASRQFVDGPHPFETLKRVDRPTTYIDEANVARVPKRADMFARAQFGDMGKANQQGATGGHYVRKAASSMALRRLLGALVFLQDGPPAQKRADQNPEKTAQNLRAASYFLGLDAVGTSRCPEWTWYSHDATGSVLEPPHDQAISMIVDQGFETMEGASGDDWISVAQSMRAYLRFSLLGGIIAQQIRNLGYTAKAHTVLDGEVLQPPLLLLSGLGEVSRIGEVILNPFLGPRLKSGVVTTDMPIGHDKPIDFGLQRFCESCNKCARECPSGAITAGPKLMFNGYEIWKSDSQKCASYRITTPGGAMCGRCMKTCPWNLEGLFAEAPFRWAAMNMPGAAPLLAKLDDMAGRGGINPVKKWWWDIELQSDGAYAPTDKPVNTRDLQTDLDLKYEDQTLAVYPAPLAPHPHPYPFPMDREAGIEAYQAMITAEAYQNKLKNGDTSKIHRYTNDVDSPVIQVQVAKVEVMGEGVTKYELSSLDGTDLPKWEAGAHLDVVVAPEFLRQYSMCGDPADRARYQIAVLREDEGRGGSQLLQRIFREGRKVFVSRPINHFPLVEDATHSFLMGGGIGITPMIAMAHRLHGLGREFSLHYSVSSRETAGFLEDLSEMPWAGRVFVYISKEKTRANLTRILSKYLYGQHVYTCGPERYMTSVLEAATAAGFPEDAQHFEYFAVPEQPDFENHPFTLRLARSQCDILVGKDEKATDALARKGFHVDVKCADGICGVCQCGLIAGEVEHRDFVLSKKQREERIILCQSRALNADGILEIDL
jgi:reductive dehalogenase